MLEIGSIGDTMIKKIHKCEVLFLNDTLLEKISKRMSGRISRWVVIATWLIVTTVLSLTLPPVGDHTKDNAANLPADADSVVAEELIKEEFPNSLGIPALLTWHREGGLTDADLVEIQFLAQTLTETPLNQQSYVPPLHQVPLPALKSSVSEDGTTFVQPIFFEEDAETGVLAENVTEIQDIISGQVDENPFEVKTDSENLSVRVTGPAGIAVDTTALFKGADFQLLLATVILVLVVLLLIYRSPLLAIIPLSWCGLCLCCDEPYSRIYGGSRMDYG